ncbi:MAG: M20/M25/M40 family metallo-hydrolase [Clostridia bacterium]|nr:M20/M25/M40 family metallo-hydrolase [Clostridia bacterium]MBR1704353.1 M20/M25/M40 family metallo-hydrolase [Clostridia bacterium]
MKYTDNYGGNVDLQKATAEGVAVVADIVGTVGPRPAGSEMELKAQKMLEEKISPYASKTVTEPFSVHRQAFMGFIPFTVACGVSSVFVNWFWSPLAAFILCVLAFIPLFFEFLRYDEFNDFLFPKQTSHNTYAVIPPAGETKQRIVMVSHSDSQYEWTLNWLFGQVKAIGDKGGLVAKLAVEIPAVVGLVIQTIFALVCLIVGKGSAANLLQTPRWFFVLFFVVSILFIPLELSFIFFQSHTKSVPGASDNLSGCAVNLETVKAMKEAGIELERTEVVAVFSGSEEVGLRGAKAFAKAHKEEYKDVPTIVVALDTFRDLEDMAIYDRDLSGTLQHDWQVKHLLKNAALNTGRDLKFESVYVGGSDAAAFTRQGYKATTLAAMNPDPPVYYHTREDTVENMRPECIAVGIDIMVEAICMYDAVGLPEQTED